jgi:AbrB family looped-hinge helix DNA binding protein
MVGQSTFSNHSSPDVTYVKLDAAGRIMIPAQQRREAGIHPGETLLLRREGNRITLMTIEDAITEAKAVIRRYLPKDADLVADYH